MKEIDIINMHKKNNYFVIFIILILIMSVLSACSSDGKKINAKYVSIYDNSHYLEFKKDGSLINSDWKVISDGEEKVKDCFIYKIDEKGIITAVDTTEYEGHDSFDEYEIGIMYKNYICIIWEGKLPQNYTYATVSNELGEDLTLTYNFYDDKTYEFMASGRGETSYLENGTYSINGNEVVCISDEIIATFININDMACCIEYMKE